MPRKALQAAEPAKAAVEISRESLSEAIAKLGDGVDRALKSGLNRKAIIVLLQAETKLPQKKIEYVLNAMQHLHQTYCR